jgi:hypothetical protein
MAFLIWAMASSRGRIPEMAKKQVCMMVLVRRPIPVSWATWVASMVDLQLFLDDVLLDFLGQVVPDFVRSVG